MCSANLSDRRRPVRFTDVKFATLNARNAVIHVGGGACKIVPNNEIGLGPEMDVPELRNEHV